ncbi:MAG: TIGR00730 family Rossman fold protein [Saprospiraceae bacterium]|nr:TIGR00730 family Rossman fold protein [Saprospiraceae bacterium]
MPKHFVHKSRKEIDFLEGPQSRWKELMFLKDVFFDLLNGLRKLHFSGPCVTVFGSARFHPEHEYYKVGERVGAEIANLGFTVMTGGGPGIMEAANKGAKSVGGRSVGCNIILPFEQTANPYLDRWVDMEFFFTRKAILRKYSYGFVVLPGGFGTMDEFFEAMTLIQTGKMTHFPIIIYGREYHKNLLEFIDDLKKYKTISPLDDKLIIVTDEVEEVVNFIKNNINIKDHLKHYNKPKKWLFE